LASLLVFLIGWWAAERYIKGSGIADPGPVVIDEVAGQWLTLLFTPQDPWLFVSGFGLFRLFDILKPWPVSWADRRLPGGFGVMADDVLAALYALASQSVLRWILAR
jgi:phosphatidylglycerophosphatase A